MIKINNKKIIKLIENKKKFLLISTKWCSPCKIIKKKYKKKLKKKLNLLFFNIDADEYKEYCMELGVKFLPSLIFDLKSKKIISGVIKIKDILKEIDFKR